MKLLRVIASMDPEKGGPCQGIRNSFLPMKELGCQMEVATLDSPDRPFLGKDAFEVHPLGPGIGPWKRQPSLIDWMVENLPRFDVVVIHGLWLYHSHAVRSALDQLKANGNPVARCYVMPHGMLDPWFQQFSHRPIKAVRNWLFWKLIERHVVNHSDGVLFTSEQERLLARLPFRPYDPREIVVGYGVPPPPTFQPEMRAAFTVLSGIKPDSPYFLFLSRIDVKKGVDLLINAYSELQRTFAWRDLGDKAPHLVIAGPNFDTPYGIAMQALAKDKCAPGTVHFPGMLSGNAKWGAFYQCSAFVLPSHQENFGIAVVEALSCGAPVLISNQVNIWREIVEGGGGYAAPDTIEGTRQLLTQGLQMTTQRADFADNAKAVFQLHYNADMAAQRLMQALEGKATPETVKPV